MNYILIHIVSMICFSLYANKIRKWRKFYSITGGFFFGLLMILTSSAIVEKNFKGLIVTWVLFSVIFFTIKYFRKKMSQGAMNKNNEPIGHQESIFNDSNESSNIPKIDVDIGILTLRDLIEFDAQLKANKSKMSTEEIKSAKIKQQELNKAWLKTSNGRLITLFSLLVFFWFLYSSLQFLSGGSNLSGYQVDIASEIIKKGLRSPSSFNLISGEIKWNGKSTEGNDAYIVRIEYDAQNGFGADIRDCKMVAFSENGDSYSWDSNSGIDTCSINNDYLQISEADIIELLKKLNFSKEANHN